MPQCHCSWPPQKRINFFIDYILPPITFIHSFNNILFFCFCNSKSSLPVTLVHISFKIQRPPLSTLSKLKYLSFPWQYLLVSRMSYRVQDSEHLCSTNWMKFHRYSKKSPSWHQHTPFPSLMSFALTLWATQLAPIIVTPHLSSIIGKGKCSSEVHFPDNLSIHLASSKTEWN